MSGLTFFAVSGIVAWGFLLWRAFKTGHGLYRRLRWAVSPRRRATRWRPEQVGIK